MMDKKVDDINQEYLDWQEELTMRNLKLKILVDFPDDCDDLLLLLDEIKRKPILDEEQDKP